MSKRRVGLTALVGCACALAVTGASDVQRATGAAATPIYLDPSYSFQERAADLVSRMTLAEKASQVDSASRRRSRGWASQRTAGGTRRCTASRARS